MADIAAKRLALALFLKLWIPVRDRYLRRLTDKPRSRDQLHDFWRSPSVDNLPITYANEDTGSQRSEFLVSIIGETAESIESALEVGCNVGRNLEYLRRASIRQLAGIEINEDATRLMRDVFPELAHSVELYIGPVENIIKEMRTGHFDLVYTMAVLQHIHPDSDWIFAEIARVARKMVITIEDEKRPHWRAIPRNYRKIFERHGLRQVWEKDCRDIEGLGSVFIARVFVH